MMEMQPMKPSDPNASDLKLIAQDEEVFYEIVRLIAASREKAIQSVNTALIELYWEVGAMISRKIEAAEWGDGVVDQLAQFIARKEPTLRGFTRRNLFRMRQFCEAYREDPIVSPLVTQLPWSHHLIILGQSKRPEEREFYLRLAIRERWSKVTRPLGDISSICNSNPSLRNYSLISIDCNRGIVWIPSCTDYSGPECRCKRHDIRAYGLFTAVISYELSNERVTKT
jgi:predicted nuclease of restriction endonuclease-like (RecB) superfamily